MEEEGRFGGRGKREDYLNQKRESRRGQHHLGPAGKGGEYLWNSRTGEVRDLTDVRTAGRWGFERHEAVTEKNIKMYYGRQGEKRHREVTLQNKYEQKETLGIMICMTNLPDETKPLIKRR